MKEKLTGIPSIKEVEAEVFPLPEEYNSWNTPDSQFKQEAWSKFQTFYTRVESAQDIPALLEAVQDYAVHNPREDEAGGAVLVEWFPYGQVPSYDYSEPLGDIVRRLNDISENGIAKHLSHDETSVDVGNSVLQNRLERIFSVRPPAEDEVIAELNKTPEDGFTDEKEGRKKVRQLHHSAERTVSGSLLEKYNNDELLTMEMLKDGSTLAADALARGIEAEENAGTTDEDLVEEKRLEKLLRGRSQTIIAGIRSYINMVLRFQRLNEQRFLGRDVLKQFEQTDHQRRRAHDALLESLQIYSNSVREAKNTGLLNEVPVVVWESEDSLKGDLPEEKVVIFSDAVLANRDYIKDWALVAEMSERLKKIDRLSGLKK